MAQAVQHKVEAVEAHAPKAVVELTSVLRVAEGKQGHGRGAAIAMSAEQRKHQGITDTDELVGPGLGMSKADATNAALS